VSIARGPGVARCQLSTCKTIISEGKTRIIINTRLTMCATYHSDQINRRFDIVACEAMITATTPICQLFRLCKSYVSCNKNCVSPEMARICLRCPQTRGPACPLVNLQTGLVSTHVEIQYRGLMGLGFGAEVWTVHLPRMVTPFDRDLLHRVHLAGSYLRITPTRIRTKITRFILI
jgi:hypothetical protein